MLVQLGFEILEEGKSISRAAGKARNDLVMMQAAHLAYVAFHYRVAHGGLAIGSDHHFIASADGEYGSTTKLFQADLPALDSNSIYMGCELYLKSGIKKPCHGWDYSTGMIIYWRETGKFYGRFCTDCASGPAR